MSGGQSGGDRELDAALDAAGARNRAGNRAWLVGMAAGVGVVVALAAGPPAYAAGGALALAVAIVLGVLVGLGIGALVVRARNRKTAFRSILGGWARRNGWTYAEQAALPTIDLPFLEQGDRRYAEDGLAGAIAGHPAEVVNFTVEEDSVDSEGRRRTDYHRYTVITVHRHWQGPEIAIRRRSFTLGRGLRNALRSSLTSEQVVEVENDEFAKRFQVAIPDDWGKDVAFLLLPPDMQEQMADDSLLPDLFEAHADPEFLFLAWKGHVSGKDLPEAERRIAAATALQERWADDVPAAMRPLPPPGRPPAA